MIPNALAAPGWATRADFDRLVRDLERLGTLLTIENFQAWIATHPRVPDPVEVRPHRPTVHRRPLLYPARPTVIPPYEGICIAPTIGLPRGGQPRSPKREITKAQLHAAFDATRTAVAMAAYLQMPEGSLFDYLRREHLTYTQLKATRRPPAVTD
jgi:hypothetical protein